MLKVRFGVRILLETRKVFRLANSILNKIEVQLKIKFYEDTFYVYCCLFIRSSYYFSIVLDVFDKGYIILAASPCLY